MKNIIYLSLIAAVLLCSCKGNSYMTQRYTRYSHGAKKTNSEVVSAKPKPKTFVNPVTVQPIFPQENLQTPVASAENVVGKQQVAERAVAKQGGDFHLPKVKDLSRVAHLPSQQLAKNTVQKQDASTANRGLIFGLIDLALFIVIVAVIIVAVMVLVFVIL